MIGFILLLTCTQPVLVALGILILADALLCLIVAVIIRIRERRFYNTEDEEEN
jgi:hydrogenase-4 membrane subunit HyfE